MDEILKLFGGIENLWAAIQKNASKVGIEATRIMLELFYVLKSPDTSMLNKSLIVAALGYQLLPEDVLPRDKYGLLGFLDNGITLAFAYNRVKSSVTPQIEQQVNNVLSSWFDLDNGSSQQDWEPSDITPGGYIPQPVFQNPLPGNNNSKPGWNDDEDVVID
jgi:uncharacterized membrane protein YkvA (DUF1232 family)